MRAVLLAASLPLVLLLSAETARAVPVSISIPDVAWTADQSGVTHDVSVHLEDLADPDPTIASIQLTVTGYVVSTLGFSKTLVWITQYNAQNPNLLRFDAPPVVATQDYRLANGDPIPNPFVQKDLEVRWPPVGDSPVGWLQNLGFGQFGSDQIFPFDFVWIGTLTLPKFSDVRTLVIESPQSDMTPVTVMFTAVPEPSTGLLVIAGLLGLTGQRPRN